MIIIIISREVKYLPALICIVRDRMCILLRYPSSSWGPQALTPLSLLKNVKDGEME